MSPRVAPGLRRAQPRPDPAAPGIPSRSTTEGEPIDPLAVYGAVVATVALGWQLASKWWDRRPHVRLGFPEVCDLTIRNYVVGQRDHYHPMTREGLVVDVVSHGVAPARVSHVHVEFVTWTVRARFVAMELHDGEDDRLSHNDSARWRLVRASDREWEWPVRFHVFLVTGEHFRSTLWGPRPDMASTGQRPKLRRVQHKLPLAWARLRSAARRLTRR